MTSEIGTSLDPTAADGKEGGIGVVLAEPIDYTGALTCEVPSPAYNIPAGSNSWDKTKSGVSGKTASVPDTVSASVTGVDRVNLVCGPTPVTGRT